MMSLTFGLFTQVSDSGARGPLVFQGTEERVRIRHGKRAIRFEPLKLYCIFSQYLLLINTNHKGVTSTSLSFLAIFAHELDTVMTLTLRLAGVIITLFNSVKCFEHSICNFKCTNLKRESQFADLRFKCVHA